MTRPGKYVVIEGHDGTGKSTQVTLLRKKLAEQGIDSIEFHEPTGTPIAADIRSIIVNANLERGPMTNVLLFSAARHDIWNNQALPALRQGKWVIASRNYFSTLAYQGYGEGVSLQIIETITRMATDSYYLRPDIALVLELDHKEREKRIAQRGKLTNPDTFESKSDDFQARVRSAYHEIAKKHHMPVLSATGDMEAVANRIWEIIEPMLYERSVAPSKLFRFSSTIKSLLTE